MKRIKIKVLYVNYWREDRNEFENISSHCGKRSAIDLKLEEEYAKIESNDWYVKKNLPIVIELDVEDDLNCENIDYLVNDWVNENLCEFDLIKADGCDWEIIEKESEVVK